MKPGVRKVLTYAAVLLGLVVLVPVTYIGYLYFTYIDETVVTGSAYGFTIGQSKLETYNAARREFEAGRIVEINTLDDREEELRSFPWLDTDLAVDDALDRLDGWDHWSLSVGSSRERPELLAVVVFDGEKVSDVGQPGRLGMRWHPPGLPAFEIHRGQSRRQFATTLQALSRSPGYESLRVSTGWMARRQPKVFAATELHFVEADDEWTLLVDRKWSYFNTVRLRFRDGSLAEIRRHRQYFELP